MRRLIEIENIEELRRGEGIEDVELHDQIRTLRAGDFVRLTFLAGAPPGGETLRVRITRVEGGDFRGRLADAPASGRLSALRVGSTVRFQAGHIHSVAKKAPAPGP
jgi:hypothetical protein